MLSENNINIYIYVINEYKYVDYNKDIITMNILKMFYSILVIN